jgi:hypothetical protein
MKNCSSVRGFKQTYLVYIEAFVVEVNHQDYQHDYWRMMVMMRSVDDLVTRLVMLVRFLNLVLVFSLLLPLLHRCENRET